MKVCIVYDSTMEEILKVFSSVEEAWKYKEAYANDPENILIVRQVFSTCEEAHSCKCEMV